MGRKTQFLNLHLADANDVYDVEVDQNQNFEKIDKKLKELDTGKETAFSKKSGFNLDKTDEYKKNKSDFLLDTQGSKKLYDDIIAIINSLDKCPYKIGDIYITTNLSNPAVLWAGTTWQKIEGKFLRATTSNENAEIKGGSDTKTLTVNNLPSHTHTASAQNAGWHTHEQVAHSHGRGDMNITGNFGGLIVYGEATGAFAKYNTKGVSGDSGGMMKSGSHGYGGNNYSFDASKSWTGSTTSAAPVINGNGSHTHTITIGNTGSGTAFDIKPAYITVHIWKRIS